MLILSTNFFLYYQQFEITTKGGETKFNLYYIGTGLEIANIYLIAHLLKLSIFKDV